MLKMNGRSAGGWVKGMQNALPRTSFAALLWLGLLLSSSTLAIQAQEQAPPVDDAAAVKDPAQGQDQEQQDAAPKKEPAQEKAAEQSRSVWQRLGLPEPNPNAPYAKPPRLETLLDDDFALDSRGDYQLGSETAAVSWEPGQLTLANQGKISRVLKAENRVELELELRFAELANEGDKSELKILLDLEPATDSYLLLRQRRSSTGVSSEIQLVGLPPSEPGQQVSAVPQKTTLRKPEGPLPSGRWKIAYCGGVWAVQGPDDAAPLQAYLDNGYVTVEGVKLSVAGQACRLAKLKADIVPAVNAEFTAEQKRELERADSLDIQSVELYRQGKIQNAIQLAEEVTEIRMHNLGNHHPYMVSCLNNLALFRQSLGQSVEAEPFFEEALTTYRRLLPRDHPNVAVTLNNLALVNHSLDRFAEAEPLYEESFAIFRRLLPRDHPFLASALNNLGGVRQSLGRTAEAEPLFEEALAMRRRLFGEINADVAKSLVSLASVRESLGQIVDAEQLLEKALTLNHQLFPGGHPDLATNLNNLAYLRQKLHRSAEAAPLFEEALLMRSRIFPGDHPDVAESLHDSAHCQLELGGNIRAAELHREATEMVLRLLERDANFQAEDEQLVRKKKFSKYINCCFDLALISSESTFTVRSLWWRWKGSVSGRQQLARQLLASGEPAERELLVKLQAASRQLATLANAPPDKEEQRSAWRSQLEELTAQRSALERELSQQSARYRQGVARLELTPEALLQRLPADILLVDFIQQSRDKETHYLAIVSRGSAPPRLLDLGPAEQINTLIEQARERDWLLPADGTVESPSTQLRQLVWEPLRPDLEGVQTVLLSPDGMLGMVPWGALPGDQPGTYLLEQYALGILPAPQLLARLLDQSGELAGQLEQSPSLLLLGDVDYGAAPGVSTLALATRSAPEIREPNIGNSGVVTRSWAPLQGAAPELSAVRQSIETRFPTLRLTELSQAQATEDRFRVEAPRHAVVHLVTHGYFAPQQLKSALAPENRAERAFGLAEQRVSGYPPGLLSGLVLAGANRPPQLGQDDGILTALEVTELDLQGVKLVTLSACETGLGPVAGGEGLLGLQRAFQLAGAETTVASLWKVPDAETQLLMKEFHRNLWERKLGRLEALRQAQLTMLRASPSASGQAETRGGKDDSPDSGAPARPAPRLWAAWLLSGDWR